MSIREMAARVHMLDESGLSPLDDQLLDALVELGNEAKTIAETLFEHELTMKFVRQLHDYGVFERSGTEASDDLANAKSAVTCILALTKTEPPMVYVLVEDGQDGINTSVHLSRAGAEQALRVAALEYSRDGQAVHTPEGLEAQIAKMRDQAALGRHLVVECAGLGTLWIDTVALNF